MSEIMIGILKQMIYHLLLMIIKNILNILVEILLIYFLNVKLHTQKEYLMLIIPERKIITLDDLEKGFSIYKKESRYF